MQSRILRFSNLVERGIVNSRPTLWRWLKAGDFPPPVKLGPKHIGWLESDIEVWLAARRRAAQAPKAGEAA